MTDKKKATSSSTKKKSTTSKSTTKKVTTKVTKKATTTKKSTTTKSKTTSKPKTKISITTKKVKSVEGLQEAIIKDVNNAKLSINVVYYYLEPNFDTLKLIRWLNQYYSLTWSIASSLNDVNSNKRLQVVSGNMYLINLELIEDSYLVLIPQEELDNQVHIMCLSETQFCKYCM